MNCGAESRNWRSVKIMRDILFRGKRTDNGKWVYGLLCRVGDTYANIRRMDTEVLYSVLTNTIGQFTGLTDKNGKKIFEGDIISCGYLCDFFVEYSEEDAEYWANFGDSIGSLHTYFDPKRATVIGNIYDNPELLEVTE